VEHRFTASMTAHSISILSELKMSCYCPIRRREDVLSIQSCYQLHSAEDRAKCPTVPQRRELLTGKRATGQSSK